MTEQVYYTVDDLAARWGFSAATIRNWEKRNYGPPVIKRGMRKFLYKKEDVEEFESNNPGLTI